VDGASSAASGTESEVRRAKDYLHGVRLSLMAVGRLLDRYADAATERAGRGDLPPECTHGLLKSAASCRAVARSAPRNLRDALQLFVMYHMVLSCLVGGRDVTPGRMDQYLLPFYRRDLRDGVLRRREAVELLAATMLMLPQLGGSIATDFQSAKRTPTRYSHYYITIGGLTEEGGSAVNELSFAMLDALRLADQRDVSVLVRHFGGIGRDFWMRAVEAMRDSLPVLVYNDDVLVPSRIRHGMGERRARGYAHCACLNCFTPGWDAPPLSEYYNAPLHLLRTIRAECEHHGGASAKAVVPAPEADDFDHLFDAFRLRLRTALHEAAGRNLPRKGHYPLAAWPLFHGHLEVGERLFQSRETFVDQRLVGLATVVDSLLAVQEIVLRRKTASLPGLLLAIEADFVGREDLLAFVRHRLIAYGRDDADVLEMAARVGTMWVEEVEQAATTVKATNLHLVPSFYSWLTNLDMGRRTPATPDGRRNGEPLSGDYLPSAGRARTPTETLRCMAALPHGRTLSGGSPLRVDPSHFWQQEGLDRLAALIEGYFAQGGPQLHLVLADPKTLEDAIAHPQRHADLLVRVTGFSEYFVRLLPQVQRDLLSRA
jgi:formate C-acetyltransferase